MHTLTSLDFGNVVKIGGLEIKHGDLLHGDRHGILSIPIEIASEIPAAVEKLQLDEQKVIDFCRSQNFSVDQLSRMMKDL